MNTHCLTSSHTNPQFYIFTQLFEARHTGGPPFDLSSNWTSIQEESWLDFWQREGHQLLEEKWNKRFPEFKEIVDVRDEAERVHWQALWEEHAKDLGARFWHIFSCAFENYQHELLKSFGSISTEDLEEIEQELEQLDVRGNQPRYKRKKKIDAKEPYLTANDDPEDIEEEEQRRLLGLPVAFGAQASHSIRRKPKAESVVEQYFSSNGDSDNMTSEEEPEPLHGVQSGFIKKKKLKKKKPNPSVDQIPDFIKENKRNMFKYWLKRFSLFSRFDMGIRLDRESWFSVTPEKIAKQTARRVACDVILDAFCGCGGNAIQFALTCGRVIAVDIDAEKLAMAKHNAAIYGVADKIEFIHADFLQFAASTRLRPDVVFFSPPWGGPSYQKLATFDIEESMLPVGASHLMQLGRRLADNVSFFLPRNASMSQVIALSGAGQQCEVEHNYLDTRLVALTAYFGSGLIKTQPDAAEGEVNTSEKGVD
ncbi:trimethylguanosine synthase [Drosophila miranda]|uniref:trimethylguanosine synthase n=1 Tax=Drosophila miranda TaxID=7229 RepID=UPI0007E71D3E|nr:trimethylguanosine synthase [Drosophila miranda]